jgi:hypothetical protein
MYNASKAKAKGTIKDGKKLLSNKTTLKAATTAPTIRTQNNFCINPFAPS